MMPWLFRLFAVLLVGFPLALAAMVYLAIDQAPLVTAPVAFTPAHIERAKRLIDRNDPRTMKPGVLRSIVVSQEDLDLAASYLASRFARGATQIALQDGAATVRATFELPPNPIGRYANIDAVFAETDHLPRIAQLRVGRLRVPAIVCNALLDQS